VLCNELTDFTKAMEIMFLGACLVAFKNGMDGVDGVALE